MAFVAMDKSDRQELQGSQFLVKNHVKITQRIIERKMSDQQKSVYFLQLLPTT